MKFANYGKKLKKIVNEIRADLLKGKTDSLGGLIQNTWEIKKKLDKSMTNKKIANMERKLCKPNLASGCRLLGTGGGGYMLFYVKPKDRFNFVDRLKKMKIEYSNIQFDLEGLKVWETDL